MNSQEHFNMVIQLKKSGSQILQKWTHVEASMAHMITGVFDEYMELMEALDSYLIDEDANEEHLVEELGDLIFYLQGLRYDAGLGPLSLENKQQVTNDSVVIELITLVKRHLYYGKKLNKQDLDKITTEVLWYVVRSIELGYVVRLIELGSAKELDLREILKSNRNKLSKRYPEGIFSDKDANERKDK